MKRTALLGLGLSLAVLTGCRGATQITLEIDTDFPCSETADAGAGVSTVETSIAVGLLGSLEGKAPVTTTMRCNGTHIGALVIVPSGSKDQEIAIEVTSGVNATLDTCAAQKQCIVARRSLHFLPHSDVALPIVMRSSCEGVTCSPDTTCVNRRCVSAICSDPESCTEGSLTGTDDTGDAGTSSDGETTASLDATLPTDDASIPGVDASSPDGAIDPIADAAPVDAGPADAGPADAALFDAGPAVTASLFAGNYNACLFRNGVLTCWGHNDLGQLGTGGGAPETMPVSPSGSAATPLQVAVGGRHTCVLYDDAGIDCWGYNAQLEIDPSGTTRLAPFRISALPGVQSLRSGDSCTYAVMDGGINTWGTLYGGASSARTFLAIPGLLDVSWGWNHACARLTDGGTSCWGDNSSGQVGVNSAMAGPFLTPAPVTIPSGSIDVALGEDHSCAVGNDGNVYCWGGNSNAQSLGTFTANVLVPTRVPGVPMGQATRVAVGDGHSCAVIAGAVWCWGTNTNSALGRTASTNDAEAVAGMTGVTEVACGRTFTCALKTGGSVQCWGYDTISGSSSATPKTIL